MKLLKKNQLILYAFVLILMTAAYLNYSVKQEKQDIETSMEIAGIGDATLVNSNEVVTEDDTIEESTFTPTEESTAETSITEESSTETSTADKSTADDYFTKSKLE